MKPLHIIDRPENRIVEIEGLKYAYSLFRGFYGGLELDEPFKIIQRDNGVITLQRLNKQDFPLDQVNRNEEFKIIDQTQDTVILRRVGAYNYHKNINKPEVV